MCPGFQRDVEKAQACWPSQAMGHRGVAEHACRESGLLDFPISIINSTPTPPQIPSWGSHGASAEHQTRSGTVIGDGISKIFSRVLHARASMISIDGTM